MPLVHYLERRGYQEWDPGLVMPSIQACCKKTCTILHGKSSCIDLVTALLIFSPLQCGWMVRFEGIWRSTSTFTDFYPPLGYEVLGGQANLQATLKSLNTSLVYESTFYAPPSLKLSNTVISDRIANVKSIALASMGQISTFLSPYSKEVSDNNHDNLTRLKWWSFFQFLVNKQTPPELLALKMDFLLKPNNQVSSLVLVIWG